MENPIKLERKLAAGETTMAIDGSWALLCPPTCIVCLQTMVKKKERRDSTRESKDSAYGFGEYAFKTKLFL